MHDDDPPSARPPLSRAKKLKLAALTLVGGVLLVGAVAEVGLRLLGYPKGFLQGTKRIWATDTERSLGWFRPSFSARISWPPELAYTVEINTLGMRGPERLPDRPVVLCVGDSTTYGSHVAEGETYPVQLQRELDQRGITACVLNAGCPRTTVTDQVDLLERALPDLQPRVVVLMFCGNDLYELEKESARERALRGRTLFSDLTSRLAISDAIVYALLEARLAQLKAKGEWPPTLRPDQGRTEASDAQWASYRAGLTAFAARVEAAGARLVLTAFPGFEEVASAEPCEIERVLPDLAREVGVDYVDLYTPFRAADGAQAGEDFLLPHDPHANARGNGRIAGVLAEALAARWPRER